MILQIWSMNVYDATSLGQLCHRRKAMSSSGPRTWMASPFLSALNLATEMIHALQKSMLGIPKLTVQERWPSLRQSLYKLRGKLLLASKSTMDLNHAVYSVLTDTNLNLQGSGVVRHIHN